MIETNKWNGISCKQFDFIMLALNLNKMLRTFGLVDET